MNFTQADVEKMIDEQRTYYFTRATKDIAFRKKQLLILKETIKKYERDVLKALQLDLNKSEFEAYTTELGIVYDSISYMVNQIDQWMKPEVVKTPLHLQPGKSFIVREP